MSKPQKRKIKNGAKEYDLRPSEKESTSGLFVSAGEISEDFDKVSWKELLEDFSNIRNGGAVESTTVSILKYPILRAGYTITHPREEIVKYCEWCFDCLTDSYGEKSGFSEFISHALLGLDFGCSFFEKVYENGVYTPDNKITNIIRRLSPFKPETIYEFHYNELMQFIGIRHERREQNTVNSFIDIPVEKLFFYSHNSEYGDPRGRSELRPIRNLYKIKKEILIATARTQQRGAGIPEIKINKANPTDQDKRLAASVGKSIGNMKSGYVITDENTTLTLHALQIQGSPEKMLEYLDRQMFFNTLTEFMTSGIGQNGSRSATSEHKGPYELKCGVIVQALESRIDTLLREMIDISYFEKLEEYPKFKFNAIQQTDIVAVADSLDKFYQSAILTKQEGDEDFLRGMFNLPLKKVEVSKSRGEEEEINKKFKSLSSKKFFQVLSVEESNNFVLKNFDSESVENLYLKTQEEASLIIRDIIKKYSLYIAKQIEAGKPVEIKYNVELSNRLNKLYRDSYEVGKKAFEDEIKKIQTGKKLEADKPDTEKVISQSIDRFSGRLIFNIKTVVEDVTDQEWNRESETAAEFILSKNFEDGFKTDSRTLIQKTSDGYLNGRGDSLTQNKAGIELYFYNSVLDKDLCNNCAMLTGSVFTLEEAEDLGLMSGNGRVNPKCLGTINQCRCVLMPYKLKGDFVL